MFAKLEALLHPRKLRLLVVRVPGNHCAELIDSEYRTIHKAYGKRLINAIHALEDKLNESERTANTRKLDQVLVSKGG